MSACVAQCGRGACCVGDDWAAWTFRSWRSVDVGFEHLFEPLSIATRGDGLRRRAQAKNAKRTVGAADTRLVPLGKITQKAETPTG